MWFLFYRLQDCSSSCFCCLPSGGWSYLWEHCLLVSPVHFFSSRLPNLVEPQVLTPLLQSAKPPKCLFFLWLLLSFSLCHMFWAVSLWCSLWCCFFLFLLIGVHWAFGICGFIVFIKFRKFFAIFFPNIFFCPLPPLWTPIRPFEIVTQFINGLYIFWYCFSLCVSFWIVLFAYF